MESKITFVKISCGYRFFGAISSEGNLYTWGYGENCELGLGDVKISEKPILITKFSDDRISQRFFVDISCSDYSYLACTDKGALYE